MSRDDLQRIADEARQLQRAAARIQYEHDEQLESRARQLVAETRRWHDDNHHGLIGMCSHLPCEAAVALEAILP